MRVLIAYDSGFGNTARVAEAMGQALDSSHPATVVQVHEVRQADISGVGLVLVGSPTRAFRPTPATTEFIARLPSGALTGVAVAAFDTRIVYAEVANPFVRFVLTTFGRYAAPAILKGLEGRGGRAVLPPEGFIVTGTEGPLKSGELERAAEWAGRAVEAAGA
jgi:flavodoxin